MKDTTVTNHSVRKEGGTTIDSTSTGGYVHVTNRAPVDADTGSQRVPSDVKISYENDSPSGFTYGGGRRGKR